MQKRKLKKKIRREVRARTLKDIALRRNKLNTHVKQNRLTKIKKKLSEPYCQSMHMLDPESFVREPKPSNQKQKLLLFINRTKFKSANQRKRRRTRKPSPLTSST